MAIAETHLLNEKVLNIEGYEWFGFNRENIHRNAKSGSGGVGFLIKNSIMNEYHVSVLDRSFEGILWLKLVHKIDRQVLLQCVCYLPPENSSRSFDVNAFYEHLIVNMYQYQKQGVVFLCGDLNSRCGELDDFIVGVDDITQRQVIDFSVNYYGELLIDFLINTNMVMLNGRFKCCEDNFTSISVKGHSIVDYCITLQEQFAFFSDFKVVTTSQLMSRTGKVGVYAPSCIPDHSLLSWKINLKETVSESVHASNHEEGNSSEKFDLKNVNCNFMSSPINVADINNLISRLEQEAVTIANIDDAYSQWCQLVRNCMYEEIPHRKVTQRCNFRKLRHNKPWWNADLSTRWENMCTAEKKWLKCSTKADKVVFKAEYIISRKSFDREVQKCKRRYWFSIQNDLLNECDVNPNEFWKSIGKIGVCHSGKKNIPEEVVLENGEISTDISEVLTKWRNDFSSLFNCTSELNPLTEHHIGETAHTNTIIDFNDPISILEVKKAIFQAKNGKAYGTDEIPAEVLKNDTTVFFLYVLFNLCFQNSVAPTIWSKTIINPIPKSSTLDPRDPLSYRGISLASAVYKVYCRIINTRLNDWVERNNVIVDEQNGFRKNRSTTDQISSLVDIIETRKKCKLPTFAAFIDFRKAYDTINRDKLWDRLKAANITGKLLLAIKSLYHSVSSCVKINNRTTEWFEVTGGLRQG